MKQLLDPVVLEESEDKGIVLTGAGIEKVKAIEVEYYNEDNDRSVYNMVSPRIKEKLRRESVQKLLLMDEFELKKSIKPSPTLNRLRISFWREFDRAQTQATDMKMSRVYAGVCPREQFETYLVNDNHTVWILKPPVDYVNAMEEALMFGIDRLREVLEVPIYKVCHTKVKSADGEETLETYEEFDPKTADILLKTVAMLDMRVKGALVQKVEQRVISENRNVNATLTANVSMDRSNPAAMEAAKQLGVGDLDAEIKRLEGRITKDVSKIDKPYTKGELSRLSKEGIKVEEFHGIDVEKVAALQVKNEVVTKKSKKIPPKVIVESTSNPIEVAEVKELFPDVEEKETFIDIDLDLGDL